MPEDVQIWCKEHRNEDIFMCFSIRKWERYEQIACAEDSVYALIEDYKSPFVPHWEEFEIDKDGMFFILADDDKIYHYHWWDWISFLNHHHGNFNAFGGWLYGGSWELMPNITNSEGRRLHSATINMDDVIPAHPMSIRFWRYAE